MKQAFFRSLVCLASLAAATAAQAQPVPSAVPAGPAPSAAGATAPRIMMLRWFVADANRAEAFYQAVLGMKTVQKMGEKVRIMIFPGSSSPGLILIESPQEKVMNGSFIIQVPDLKATLDLAKGHGAKLENTDFRQQMGAAQARSSHFIDPDGNEIEVLQMSAPAQK